MIVLKKNLPQHKQKYSMRERDSNREGLTRIKRVGVTPFRNPRILEPFKLTPPHPNNPTRFVPLRRVA